MTDLAQDLLSSFVIAEAGLNGSKNLGVVNMRKEALDRFETAGFPTTRDEEWKYTNLKPVLKHDYKIMLKSESAVSFGDIKQYLLSNLDTYKLVFINGKYSSWLSESTHQSYDICTFAAALNKYPDVIAKYLGKAAPAGETFVDLNTAFADDGAYIRVKANQTVDKPIEILYITTDENGTSFSQNRNLIIVEQNAEVQVLERHQNLGTAESFTNFVSEVFAAPDARLNYYKVQNDSDKASLVDNTHVNQETGSLVHVGTYSFGGKLVRNNLNFYSGGEHAESHMDGITIIGDGQTVDHHTLVDHQEPHCYSRELYKGIYLGNSHGVFNGKVLVRQKAQKTNAFQQNDNILLSDKAKVDTKPQLEIFADDVRCSHGCTVGQLDKNALFYLRSRGIPKFEAQGLMTYAFASDALEYIKIPQLQKRLNGVIAEKLGINLEFAL
ncbi:MAG TPA: Fe-S cluster assembly protein SufD [Cryomorphaceae bacterium]|nr:Fe-S cluster assembly protein SufD [Cryomorphaceae bacterium]|tara:strand:+ start:691 stop:2010 length:1320 start_codon:yes stop_codon:yes gene_type:complete